MELLLEKADLPQEQSKKVVAIIGRAQPPTQSHYKVIDAAKKFIRQHRGVVLDSSPVFIVIGGSNTDEDKHRNPLSIEDRIRFMKASGRANGVIFLHAKDAFLALALLRKKGMEPIAVAAGSDKIQAYKEMLDKYFVQPNGKPIPHFAINVVRNTDRSTDSTLDEIRSGDVNSMDISGSVARRAVELGYLPEFTKIVGLEDKPKLAQQMYDKIAQALKSEVKEATRIDRSLIKADNITLFKKNIEICVGNHITHLYVVFGQDGTVSPIFTDTGSEKRSEEFWQKHKEEIIKVAKDYIKDHVTQGYSLSKETILTRALDALKRDMISKVELIIAGSRVLGYDYPEFKVIEKSLNSNLRESEDGPFYAGGYYFFKRTLYVHLVNRNKKIKIDICFEDGKIDPLLINDDDEVIWKKHKDQLIEAAKRFIRNKLTASSRSDAEISKEEVLKNALEAYKRGNLSYVRFVVIGSRILGYDWPELKAIEKSLNSQLKESEEDDFKAELAEIRSHNSADSTNIELFNNDGEILGLKGGYVKRKSYHGYEYHAYSIVPISTPSGISPDVICFTTRDQLVKKLLEMIKEHYDVSDYQHTNNIETVKKLIALARENNYDFHEFKSIEKSLGKIQESVDDDEIMLLHNGVESGIDIYDGSIAPVFPNADNPNKKIAERASINVAHYRSKKLLIRNLLSILAYGSDIINDRIIKNLIKLARENGYDYPEFKSIEKSIGIKEGLTEEKIVKARTIQQFLELLKDKNIKEIALFNGETYSTKTTFNFRDRGNIHYTTVNCASLSYPNSYIFIHYFMDNPEPFLVTFSGRSSSKRIILNAEDFLKANLCVRTLSKKTILRKILNLYQHDPEDNKDMIKKFISQSRECGYDYPEFKSIEKSMESK